VVAGDGPRRYGRETLRAHAETKASSEVTRRFVVVGGDPPLYHPYGSERSVQSAVRSPQGEPCCTNQLCEPRQTLG
jgi:hypothetical protein